jgi:hypothetical protein
MRSIQNVFVSTMKNKQKSFANIIYITVAEDRARWQEIGETYVQQRTVVG